MARHRGARPRDVGAHGGPRAAGRGVDDHARVHRAAPPGATRRCTAPSTAASPDAAGEEHGDAGRVARVDQAARHQGRGRVGEQRLRVAVGDQGHDAGAPEREGPRRRIGPGVADGARGRQHALARGRRHPVGVAVGVGDGPDRDAGGVRDVAQRGAAGAPGGLAAHVPNRLASGRLTA